MDFAPKKNCRVFFAMWPQASESAALVRWQAPLSELCGGKAMHPDTLHCTLVFLGTVAGHRLQALRLAAREVTFKPFALEWDAAHYWRHNRIVYAAMHDTQPELEALVASLKEKLRAYRFHFETRPFKAHVTLLRNAQWTDAPLPPMPAVRWRVKDFVLLQSLGDAQGARYEVLWRYGEI